MIDEIRIHELRKSYHDHWLELEENGDISDTDFATAKDMLDTLENLLRVARAAELTDKRCLKFGVLPDKKICLNIETWKGEQDLSCVNCKLWKALDGMGE